jgi:hypothetical protein
MTILRFKMDLPKRIDDISVNHKFIYSDYLDISAGLNIKNLVSRN